MCLGAHRLRPRPGERDQAALAVLAKGKLRPKMPELAAALDGHSGEHHAIAAAQILAHLDFLSGVLPPVGRPRTGHPAGPPGR